MLIKAELQKRDETVLGTRSVPEDARGCYEDICERCPEGRKAQREIDAPVHKDAGGQIGMNGECLACTAEQGEACRRQDEDEAEGEIEALLACK